MPIQNVNLERVFDSMGRCYWIGSCLAVSAGVAIALVVNHQERIDSGMTVLTPFEFQRESAPNPGTAATALFLGVATESPRDFTKHLLLGVCDGSVDTIQKFAEAMHTTRFTNNGRSFSFYELKENRRGINSKKQTRVISCVEFDDENPAVIGLQAEAISTYYGQEFACVDVAGESYDGIVYRTRVVVARLKDGWYAIPRCRSSRNFYKIADSMMLASDLENGTLTEQEYSGETK